MNTTAFALHPQLAQDTTPVGDLPLASVLLANDAHYPWLILVPRRAGLVEIFDLAEAEQTQLLGEIRQAAMALKQITECEKLNIAAIGNVVSQLHVHIVARRHADACWPKPVWGQLPAVEYTPAMRHGLIAALRKALQLPAVQA